MPKKWIFYFIGSFCVISQCQESGPIADVDQEYRPIADKVT
jgi:hypothetical protein